MTDEKMKRAIEIKQEIAHANISIERACSMKPVGFEITFVDKFRNTSAEIEDRNPEITNRLLKTIIEYYEAKKTRLEKEFLNL